MHIDSIAMYSQGPMRDGRPQVEVVLRIRLPLAEFFDALLLTLAEQHPLSSTGRARACSGYYSPSQSRSAGKGAQ